MREPNSNSGADRPPNLAWQANVEMPDWVRVVLLDIIDRLPDHIAATLIRGGDLDREVVMAAAASMPGPRVLLRTPGTMRESVGES